MATMATPAQGSTLTHREILVVFSGLMLGLFLAAVDQTIVATALPTIVGELGGLEHLSWVVTAYLLTSTAAVPLYGKISDLYGRKPLFQSAIVIFVAGSVLAAVASSMLLLVIGRGIQGVGGGGLMAMTFAIVGDVLSPRQRGRYMGYLTGVFAAASVTGPLLGGYFVDNLDWRWVFWINIPLGAAALVVTTSRLRLPVVRTHHPIDWLGAGLLVTSVTTLLLVSVWGGTEYAWSSPQIVGLGLAGVTLAVLFVLQERRAPEPILPLRLFHNPVVAVALSVGVLLGSAMFGAIVFLPLFLQAVTGASATASGLLMLPLMAGVTVTATFVGRAISRTGHYRVFPVVGMGLATVGLALLALLDADTPRWLSSVDMALVGMGLGMTMPTLNLASQNAVEFRDLGVVTGAINFSRTLGGAFGVAAYGAVLTATVHRELPALLPPTAGAVDVASLTHSPDQIRALPQPVAAAVTEAIARGVGDVFLWAVPVALLGWAIALLLKELPLRESAHVTLAPRATAEGPGVPAEL